MTEKLNSTAQVIKLNDISSMDVYRAHQQKVKENIAEASGKKEIVIDLSGLQTFHSLTFVSMKDIVAFASEKGLTCRFDQDNFGLYSLVH